MTNSVRIPALIFVAVVLGVLTATVFQAWRGSAAAPAPGRTTTPPPQLTVITELPEPEGQLPPSVPAGPKATFVTPEGRELAGGIGSRCWESVCVDAVGPVTNVEPFFIPIGSPYAIKFEAGKPAATDERWYPVLTVSNRVSTDGRVWMEGLGAGSTIAPSAPGP